MMNSLKFIICILGKEEGREKLQEKKKRKNIVIIVDINRCVNINIPLAFSMYILAMHCGFAIYFLL